MDLLSAQYAMLVVAIFACIGASPWIYLAFRPYRSSGNVCGVEYSIRVITDKYDRYDRREYLHITFFVKMYSCAELATFLKNCNSINRARWVNPTKLEVEKCRQFDWAFVAREVICSIEQFLATNQEAKAS